MLSVDGVGAFDLISRAAYRWWGVPRVRDSVLRSTYFWEDDSDVNHEIVQGEGGKQDDPLLSVLFAVSQHRVLATSRERLFPHEHPLRTTTAHHRAPPRTTHNAPRASDAVRTGWSAARLVRCGAGGALHMVSEQRIRSNRSWEARAQEFLLGEAIEADARVALLEAVHVCFTVHVSRQLAVPPTIQEPPRPRVVQRRTFPSSFPDGSRRRTKVSRFWAPH